MSAIQALIESDRDTAALFKDESKEYIELIEQAAAELAMLNAQNRALVTVNDELHTETVALRARVEAQAKTIQYVRELLDNGDNNRPVEALARAIVARVVKLEGERDRFRVAVQSALIQLQSTQRNWDEDCLFKCNDILNAAPVVIENRKRFAAWLGHIPDVLLGLNGNKEQAEYHLMEFQKLVESERK